MRARLSTHLALLAVAACLGLLAAPASAEPARDDWHIPSVRRLSSAPVYRTQLDGSRYAGSNCGPAVMGMVLDAYGIELPTLDIRQLTHTYQGTWPGRGGTALQHMARVGEDFGLKAYGLYEPDGESFHRWTVEEIKEQVARGRWVIPLVRYGMLPGHETTGIRFGHYILLYAIDGNGFTYHDSAYRPISEGAGRWISFEQLDAAMSPVLVPRQAVALGT